jgi:HEAT repeat protein
MNQDLENLLQQCTVKLTLGKSWGTGFFVAPGFILTCAHVVREAADLQVTVFYPARQQPLSAIVKAKADDGKTLDLALVELSEPLSDHPCVLLDEEPVAIGQALYSYGYLKSYVNAAPVRPVNEGLTGDTPPLLKLQGAQIEKGISGAALLNLKSGKVCGMVKETRDAGFDLGGGAIPTRVILEQFPELRSLQQAFHGRDRRWRDLVAKRSEIDFQPYLEAIATTYEKWWQLYTLTDAEGKQRQSKDVAPIFDFGLMVQTVKKKEREQKQEEKVERFPVLEGIRKYADQHVLLVGRPGSGKSTALTRLLLEEATTQKSEVSQKSEVLKTSNFSPTRNTARIPVLVELRYWQGSIAQLILNVFARHGLPLTLEQLETVLARSLILFDGVNELPSEEARSQLVIFRRDHPKLPMIFTTRDLSLGGDLGIEQKLEMQPLTEAQMQAFVRAYVPEQAEIMLRQLRDRLHEFGQTPLLLWMLCEVFQQAPDNQLPSNLAGVFRSFTTLYEQSSVRKHEVALLKGDVRPLSDRRLWKRALKALASVMMQGETLVDFRVVIDRDEAERELNRIFPTEQFPVRDILDDLLKYHLLQNRSADQIEFHHQLLQDYYAAEYLLQLLPALTDEQLKRDYLNYLKWTEPVALMLAMVEEEAQALRVVKLAMDEVDLMLGARLAGEVKPAFQSTTVGWIDALEIPPLLRCQCWATSQSKLAIAGLLKALEHQNSDVRRSAAKALGQLGSVEAIAGLLKALEHQDSDVRWRAAEALGQLGSIEAMPGLLKALKDQDSDVRWRAAEALGQLGSIEAMPGLLKAIEDQNSSVRWSAAEALGKLGSVEAIPGLLKALKHQNSSVRKSAAYALGKLGSIEAMPGLLKALEEQDSFVRRRAAYALGQLGFIEAMPGLLKALKDQDSDVRWSAAEALGQLGSVEAMPGLLKVLKDQGSDVRWSAAKALGQLGSVEAISGLLKVLKDQGSDVRWSAAKALGQLGSVEAISGLLKALEEQDSFVRESAAEALGQLGFIEAMPGLLKALKDQDSDVRWSAAEALGQLGFIEAMPGLLKALEDQDSDVRRRAAYALGQLGSVAAMPGLLKALEEQDSFVREGAVEALGQLGNSKLLAELWKQQFISSETDLYSVISTIQNRCKYYNHEIAYNLPPQG